ncbi:hypothetical protein LJR010_004428 [Ensifer adhaerens]|uniref:class I SAM-dependent methyltransferase n=1 Tax=Ensifer adhaerens TaxID=106592 RepID=UPI0039999D5E
MVSEDKLHTAIKAVWNNAEDETYRQDQSHYRGVGRWADDEAWQDIGRSSMQKIKFLWRLLNRPNASLANQVVLEWGPGGGANAFGLREISSRYYGVDISEKNLAEAGRMMTAEGRPNYFKPVLLAGVPQSIVGDVEPINIFLSTAVFQHFPSRDYGIEVLKALRSMCAPNAGGFIQIRFDNGNPKYRGIASIQEYEREHITANSYPIEVFWDALDAAGFQPLAVNGLRTKNNYATFYMAAK